MKRKFYIIITIIFILSIGNANSQKKILKKYPSLFWEITGNGLKKPSYLFGTMHVSSKMVFHLSDSFYIAMKNVDAVALELNPDLWQGQMVHLDQLKENYANFVQSNGNEYLNENSFRIGNYDAALQAALSTEPTAVNNLLYRSYKAKEDFEEDTFLDLYIFQTGKKLGKRSAGVEDYNETEKVVLEAYADMAKEKKQKNIDVDEESLRNIGQKIQDAYHSGDLDLMDSLDILTEKSKAFREKFLYQRNVIQAGSIDTILKKSSLFVGVGAAHLPGPRGVIELLKKMGYHLRPIKMTDRDAVKKEQIDLLKAPVKFSTVISDDHFYSVNMPGALFKMNNEYQLLDRRQYADMSNGSYYLVTRIKTFSSFLKQPETMVLKKIDSLLYENIPGKIIKKISILKNGYPGFNIINKTRRGDLQRYNIFVTPFEIIIFKMSGKENYVMGKEAADFFSSIQLKEISNTVEVFTPLQGGFTVKFPQPPHQYLNSNTTDGIKRWEYEAIDKKSGDAYLIMKKSVTNYKFLEEDSFDLELIEASFRSPDYFNKQLNRTLTNWLGYPCLEVKERMKNGNIVTARYIIKGAHYYCLAVSSKNIHNNFDEFFNSFSFTPFKYYNTKMYVDTFLNFSVNTSIAPELDETYRDKLETVTADIANNNAQPSYNNYWPKSKNAFFTSDSTGETIAVTIKKYPKYYVVKDSLSFWKTSITDQYNSADLVLHQTDSFFLKNGVSGYKYNLRDTGSSRTIKCMMILKDNYLFNITTLSDTLNKQNDFTDKFFTSFKPVEKKLGKSIYSNNLDSFFINLFSNDSVIHEKARQAISNIYYGEDAIPKIVAAIISLKNDKDYIDIKTKLIAELGYIKDTGKLVVSSLKYIYEQTADTSIFENEVIKALARQRTAPAFNLLKELMIQNPPVLDNSFDYTIMFNNLTDSLKMAANLFPELLQLSNIDDYKKPVLSLLVALIDSGFKIHYDDYFNKIYFDAKIELKKQQGRDEKKLNAEKNKENDEAFSRSFNNIENKNELNDYAILLMPFYNTKNNVPLFFSKLIFSNDDGVRFNAAILLLQHNKPVAKNVIEWFAEKDAWSAKLYTRLKKINRLDMYPAINLSQLNIARSLLVSDKDYSKLDSIIFAGKQLINYQNKNGFVYFFKYRIKKDDGWKIGLSGLQPEHLNEIGTENKLSVMTDKKINLDVSEEEQFQEQLKKLLITSRKSATHFFEGESNNYHYSKNEEYDEH